MMRCAVHMGHFTPTLPPSLPPLLVNLRPPGDPLVDALSRANWTFYTSIPQVWREGGRGGRGGREGGRACQIKEDTKHSFNFTPSLPPSLTLDVSHQIVCCERADRNQVFVPHVDSSNRIGEGVIRLYGSSFFLLSTTISCKGREGGREGGSEGGRGVRMNGKEEIYTTPSLPYRSRPPMLPSIPLWQ